MAITKGAKKAIRQAARKKVFNDKRRRAMREAIKRARGGNAETLASAYKAIDKAMKTGILKKNAAARKKSQLAKLFAKK